MAKGDGRGDADIERGNAIKNLIKDCIAFDLNERESIEYISVRIGKKYTRGRHKDETKKIGAASFYNYKKEVKEELGNIDTRMYEHAKVGFVSTHFEIMDTAKRILNHLASTLFTTQNAFQKAAIAQQAREYGRFLDELNVSSPIIDQMRQYIADNLKSQTNTKDDTIADSPDLPPSALTLPKGFIKSSVDATNDGRGVSTGKESIDRVFEKSRKTERKTLLDQGFEGT